MTTTTYPKWPVLAALLLWLGVGTVQAQYALFDLATDTIQVSGQTVIGTASTYEAQILFPSSFGAEGFIFNEHQVANEDKQLRAGPNSLAGFNFAVGGASTLNSSQSLSLDVWHHVAYVYDGSQERLYLDGVLTAFRAASGDVADSSGGGFIGAAFRSDSGVSDGFLGYLDSVRLSNVARYAGNSFTAPVGDLSSDAATLLLYNFNAADVSGNTIADLSPAGRTGAFATGFGTATAPTIVPEPSSWALAGVALAVLVAWRQRALRRPFAT